MKVLVINCGSSTLKFKLFEVEEGNSGSPRESKVACGSVDRIGGEGSSVDFFSENGESLQELVAVPDHDEAFRCALDWLRSTGLVAPEGPDAIGHRVVHGGEHFSEPVLIEDEVMGVIEALVELAPLHNGPSLATIRAARALLGPSVPMVAVFDTAFHRTMPEHASLYAIPRKLTDRYHIRRYGFHGTAHRYMTERYADIVGEPVDGVKLITLQLGNGCSATAVKDGRSVETSMGFTPLEGLVMGTRCGDIDPSLVRFLAEQEGVGVVEVEGWLNKRSGLLGVSGISRDMRELLEAGGDPGATLAIEMFCHRIRKYVGAYLAVMDSADAVVFGGGIGENVPEIRARVCTGMGWCGLELDEERNARTVKAEGRISTEDSTLHAYVILVDEEMLIAHDTVRCLRHHER